MTKHEKFQLGVSRLVKTGLTAIQSSLIYKQTDPEWEEKEDIYCYLNKDGTDIYAMKRLGRCCGPSLSVSCRALRKKGYIAFDLNDEIEVQYGSGVKTAYRVLFSNTPKYKYDPEERHPVAYFERYFK